MKVSFAYGGGDWKVAIYDVEKFSRNLIGRAFKAAGFKPTRGSEVCVLLTDDKEIRALNKKWRGKDEATNVLSFPTDDETMLGDIALSLDTLSRETEEQGKDLRAHYAHLVVHGALHLLGFDHAMDDEADEMEFFEGKILEEMGIGL